MPYLCVNRIITFDKSGKIVPESSISKKIDALIANDKNSIIAMQ
mgnify:CR=1 FL=1|jgi:hypothetical protein